MFFFVSDTEVALLNFFPCAGTSCSNNLWLDQVDLNYSIVTGWSVIHPFQVRSPASDSSDGLRMMFSGKSCGKRAKSIEVEKQFITKMRGSLLKNKKQKKTSKTSVAVGCQGMPHISEDS